MARFCVWIVLLALAQPGLAHAQTGQWGQFNPPQWGQYSQPAWGQYNNQVSTPWQYNKVPIPPPEPGSAVLNPNQNSGNFTNPATGSSLFVPQDTRFLGRDRP